MSIITLQAIKKDFGIKEVLREASCSIEPKEKVGLIGINGSGKSTLLKMIAGIEPVDGGKRLVKSGTNIVYLPQQPSIDPERSVLDQVFCDAGEQMQLVRDYENLIHQISQAQGEKLNALLGKLTKLNEQMERAGAWELETNAKIVLSKLGIDNFEARVGDLSGGYRKRIALAAALLSEPELLLMDEPTNHLDAESVEWLQNYLARFSGAILLITHDRYFLDRVTNRILEIDRGDLYTYAGNYSYYLEKKALAEAASEKGQRKHQGVLRRELEWLKRGPKARSTKQKARIDRIHEMQNKSFKSTQDTVKIDTPGRRIGKKAIDLKAINKRYNDKQLIRDFTHEFVPGDRVGIIGRNGVGKSTLMDIITGRLEPDSGTVEIGSTIHFGYFDQHSDTLLEATDQNQRVIDYLKAVASIVKTADGTEISASQMLERFLFPSNQQYAPIHKLSGGEKRRLFLLRVLMQAPNILILDEPTNDLDVQTLSVLEEYLESFNGCVIVVSHDRYFLDRTVDLIFAFEAEGTIRQYPGNYSLYLEQRKTEESQTKVKTSAKPKIDNPAKQSPVSKNIRRRLSNYQRRELETLEVTIPQLEQQKAEIEAQLYQNPPVGYSKVQELSEQVATLSKKINSATERWLELAELDN